MIYSFKEKITGESPLILQEYVEKINQYTIEFDRCYSIPRLIGMRASNINQEEAELILKMFRKASSHYILGLLEKDNFEGGLNNYIVYGSTFKKLKINLKVEKDYLVLNVDTR